LSLFVVRHAKAGSRHDWAGDDDAERPLTKSGRRQADALAERLAGAGIGGLWSSPYVRCMQTLAPLAARLGMDVVADDRLAEGAPFEPVLSMLAQVPDGAVLCGHGDLIPELIAALDRRGTTLLARPDWRKAALWVLDEPDATGHVATATVEPPPA
jgi:8-oxo-dGTP diphosphatase